MLNYYAISTTQKDSAESGQTQPTTMLDVYDLKSFSCASLGGRDGHGHTESSHLYDPKDSAESAKSN